MLVLQAANAYSPRNYSYSPKNDATDHMVNDTDDLLVPTKNTGNVTYMLWTIVRLRPHSLLPTNWYILTAS